MDLGQLVELMKESAADRTRDLEPDGDILPQAVATDRDGGLIMMAIDPAYMENIETKDNLAATFRRSASAPPTHSRRNSPPAARLINCVTRNAIRASELGYHMRQRWSGRVSLSRRAPPPR